MGFLGMMPLALSAQDTIVSKESQYRKIVLEEFTGMHCPNCPAGHKVANEILSAYPEECFLINIHCGDLAVPAFGELDMRSSYGEALAAKAGLTGIPSAEINRHKFPGLDLATSQTSSWMSCAEEILGMESYVNVGAEAEIDWQSWELKVKVQLYYTGESPLAQNYVHVALLQNNVETVQDNGAANPDQLLPNGNYLHQHVLRDLLTGLDGDAVDVAGTGTFIEKTYRKNLPETINNLDVDIMQLQLVVFVTESENEIMNACQAPIYFENGPEYVFEMSEFEQLPQNTCDNDIRLSFDFKNLNRNENTVENATFAFRTPEGKTHEYTASFSDFAWNEEVGVETDAFGIDRIGSDDTVYVRVTAVNGQALSQVQEETAVPVMKSYVVLTSDNVVLDVWQDRWGSETSWDFISEDGEVLASVDAYEDLPQDGEERHTHEIRIAPGCNIFVIRDMMKDGINNGDGNGHLQLSDAEGKVLLSDAGTFTDSLVWLVRYSAVANEKPVETSPIRLWPNPASSSAYLEFDLPEAGNVEISIFNMEGRRIKVWGSKYCPAGRQVVEIPVQGLASGMYVWQMRMGNSTAFGKLSVR